MSEGKKEETVQQHVERTMHTLLTRIDEEIQHNHDPERIEKLCQAFASLSCWPKEYVSPEQHRQLAEYEVEKAFKRREGST